jgi:drug/metabolite transporter (DMT)-like permease
MSDTKPSAQAIFLLIVLSLIWGTSFILIKQGLKVFPPDQVGAIRVLAASIFLLPFAIPRLKELKQGDHFKLLVSGMMAIFIPAFLFATAQTHLESSLTGILNTLSPVFMAVVGTLFFQQRFKGYAVFGIAISMAGAILLTLTQAENTALQFNSYALLVVAACVFYGANLNWIKFKVTGLGSITITSVSLLFIGPLAAAYLFGFTDFISILTNTPQAWKAFGFIVVLALMSTAIANLLFNKLIKISTPIYASSVTYLMPIVSVMWGVLDGEKLLINHFIGMAAILGGVYLANKKQSISE